MDKAINFHPAWRSSSYYFFLDDVQKYPDAWLYVVWSRRGPGKTYSFLRSMYENRIPFVYMKRTKEDVDMISMAGDIDISPFKPINRDAGTNIQAKSIRSGIAGFYDQTDEEGKPSGAPFAYILALNSIKTIKGMDLSEVDFICLDEFIPQPGEKISRREGEMLLSIYMTVQRDRMKRGRGPLKLVLFSNAEEISTPITNEIEIVDSMAELQGLGGSHHYDAEREIMLHHITEEEIPLQEEEKTGIYKAMAKTAWGRKAFGGEFAGNDFSNVARQNLKGYRCIFSMLYREKMIYVYQQNGTYYLTYTRGQPRKHYDLTKENDQKLIFYDEIIDIREACIEGKMKAEAYTMYDLVINFRKIYKVD